MNSDKYYIFAKNYLVTKLSRIKKNDLYCTGIQVINPKLINKNIKPTSDFNNLWKKLIKKKMLYVSDIQPKKWFTVDNIKNYKALKKIKL